MIGLAAGVVLAMTFEAPVLDTPKPRKLVGCGVFVYVTDRALSIRGGAKVIVGDVLVRASDGQATLDRVAVDGTVTAHALALGEGVVVRKCRADEVTGPGRCLDVAPFRSIANACKLRGPR